MINFQTFIRMTSVYQRLKIVDEYVRYLFLYELRLGFILLRIVFFPQSVKGKGKDFERVIGLFTARL